MEDPMPNELDNALSQLIPAVKTCSNPNDRQLYRDLNTFETMASTAPSWRALTKAGATAGGVSQKNGGAIAAGVSSIGETTVRTQLDERVASELEVAFRHCMHEAAIGMVEQEGDSTQALELSLPVGLLTLALDFATAEAARSTSLNKSIAALPMVLLEDFLESQGTESCKEIWAAWVEPNTSALTAAPLLVVGVYTLIRLCNKLAARMSKTYDSSFCGQIHLFLSKAVSFFDRSGLNVTGAVNATNETEIEARRCRDPGRSPLLPLGLPYLQFPITIVPSPAGASAASGCVWLSSLNAHHSLPAKMDEEVFRQALAGFQKDNARDIAGSGDGTGGQGAAASGHVDAMVVDSGSTQEEFTVDYRLYQSFWRLQKYAMAQDTVIRGKDAESTWKALLNDVDQILGAFEANAFSEEDLRLAKDRWKSNGGGSSSSSFHKGGVCASSNSGKRKRRLSGSLADVGADVMDVEEVVDAGGGVKGATTRSGRGYFGLKYLTSPRLLRLQLRDPTLRLQVLTQWLIIAASLKSKLVKEKDSPNSAVDLNQRMERAKKLVKTTPPRGEEYLRMLQTVLHRESAWTQWKDVNKCKAVESIAAAESKAAAAAEAKAAESGAVSAKSKATPLPAKRIRTTPAVAAAERAKHAPLDRDFTLDKIVMKLRNNVPSSEEHLEDQRMCAEDTESPESELPSANTLYAWRARRKLTVENPDNLAGCFDGDIVKVMARMDEAKKVAAEKAKEGAAAAEAAEAAEAAATAAKIAADAVPMNVDNEQTEGNGEGGDGVGKETQTKGESKQVSKVESGNEEEPKVQPSDGTEATSNKCSTIPVSVSGTSMSPKLLGKDGSVDANYVGGGAKEVATGTTPVKPAPTSSAAAATSPKVSTASIGKVNGGEVDSATSTTPSSRVLTRRSSRSASRMHDAGSPGGGGDAQP